MNTDILLLIKACENILQIKKRVNITIKTQETRDGKGLAGYCDSNIRNGKLTSHRIVINIPTVMYSEYNINDVIAHEMIHAAMIEHNLFNDDFHHDHTFQQMANHLKTYLNNLGFSIEELYNPQVDTD